MNNNILVKENLQFEVTKEGQLFFKEFGIDLDSLHRKRRAFSKCCLDWTERQHHIAGALGKAILERMLEQNWVTKAPKTRAIHVTHLGEQQILRTFLIK